MCSLRCLFVCFFQGLASNLLAAYVEHVRRTQTGVEKIMLLTKEALIPFYQRAGFVFVGESGVNHGEISALS